MTTLTTIPSEHQVGQYCYYYGPGSEPNRRIVFYENGSDPQKSVTASVFAVVPGGFREISALSADKMTVDMLSTSKKMEALIKARAGIATSIAEPQEKPLASLPTQDQETIIRGLQPKGTWRIELTNGFGSVPRFEKIESIHFYDPS